MWQGWAQQSVLECPVWFSVLDRDLRISVVELPKNEVAIDALRLEADVFGEWIDNNTPPMEEINNFTADDIARIWKVTPTIAELDATAAQLVIDLEKARTISKEASDAEARIKDALAQIMLNHEIGVFNGQKILSWQQQAGKMTLDTARLRADHPELVKQYEKQSNSYRVMRTHRKKVK